ncbi:hypothetical protein NFI96_029388 [Prochilodus magdalenae]|nr:hypothetical protein NFI96_029388 [Prochilodus magdalenae]
MPEPASAGALHTLVYRVAVNGVGDEKMQCVDCQASGPALEFAGGATEGPLGSAGQVGPRAAATAAGTYPALGGLPHTIRFQWRDPEGGALFTERVPFIREVLFGALGLKPEDLICAQRNNAQRQPTCGSWSKAPHWGTIRWGSTFSWFLCGTITGGWSPPMFLILLYPLSPSAGSCKSTEKSSRVKDGSGTSWEFGTGAASIGGQPAFCKGCLKHGHQVDGCKDMECKHCLGRGHLARDSKNPRRCRRCGREGHLAHSCPSQAQSYAAALAGSGGAVGGGGEDRARTDLGGPQCHRRGPRHLLPGGGRVPSPRAAPLTCLDPQPSRTEARKKTLPWEEGPLQADGSAVDGDRLRDLRLMAAASGETAEPGPRGSAGLDGGPSAASAEGGSLQPRLGGGPGAGFRNTVRFQCTNAEPGEAFVEQVPFIREILFDLLGLRPEDLICAQRNNALRFFDVTMATEAVYQRVLEQRSVLGGHPLGRLFTVHGMWHSNRRMVTIHIFNPFVSAESVRQFLQQYGEVQPGERMVRDELGIWNGRRQFLVDLREDGMRGLIHPPGYFSLGGKQGLPFLQGVACLL